MTDWIFTGHNNIPAPLINGKRQPAIRPYEPFDCTAEYRARFVGTPNDRKLMTVADYEKRLRTFDLGQLLSEMRTRKINVSPADVRDCRWLPKPLALHRLFVAALHYVEDPEWIEEGVPSDPPMVPALREGTDGHRYAQRYEGFVDGLALAQADASHAAMPIRRGVREYILDDVRLTEAELMAEWIDRLMEPLLAATADAVAAGDAPPVNGNGHASDDLADRRERVKHLLGAGKTQKAIAELLGVSRSTVRNDIKALGL